MSVRSINKVIIIIAISLSYLLPLFADAPYEKFHVPYNDQLRTVLKNTIGILTIINFKTREKELKTYLKTKEDFTYDKSLKIRDETIPVSNCGYHPPIFESSISNYRYPIVEEFGEYLRIAYDPINNLKVWVNRKEVEENFHTSVVMLDSIKTPLPDFVDIFYFTKSGKRKLYKEPKKDAEFTVISEDKYKYTLLKIIDQENGFVKMGIYHFVYQGESTIEPIGWIRLRDDQGALMIWIKGVDLC